MGDVMVDAYLWGKVDRISPEAPVPIRINKLGAMAGTAPIRAGSDSGV